MTDTSNFRNGLVMRLEGKLYSIVEFQHVKPGKGPAFVRTKIKKIPGGAVIEKTFRAGEKIEEVRVEKHKFQFLYEKNDLYNVMNVETYAQIALPHSLLEDQLPFLKENLEILILFDDTEPIAVDFPIFVELEVIETEPGFKGDTAQGGSKSATLETGFVVNVPLFIELGDILKIDTRSGKYVERV
ncbi:elongation factor P [bacterium]|nr:elongation factor P [bacterium]